MTQRRYSLGRKGHTLGPDDQKAIKDNPGYYYLRSTVKCERFFAQVYFQMR